MARTNVLVKGLVAWASVLVVQALGVDNVLTLFPPPQIVVIIHLVAKLDKPGIILTNASEFGVTRSPTNAAGLTRSAFFNSNSRFMLLSSELQPTQQLRQQHRTVGGVSSGLRHTTLVSQNVNCGGNAQRYLDGHWYSIQLIKYISRWPMDCIVTVYALD